MEKKRNKFQDQKDLKDLEKSKFNNKPKFFKKISNKKK